jgi:fructose-bisphosphate aldolase class 1
MGKAIVARSFSETDSNLPIPNPSIGRKWGQQTGWEVNPDDIHNMIKSQYPNTIKIKIFQSPKYSNQMCTEVAKLLEEVQKRRDQMKESWSRALQQQQIAQMLEETKHFFEQLAGCHLFESIQKKCRSAIWLRSHGM